MAALAPSRLGSTVVPLVTRGSKRHGGATITWDRTLGVNTDCRGPLQHAAVRLARHYRASLRAGVRDDTGAALERDADGTPPGLRSGWAADHWIIGPIRGDAAKATVFLRIYDRSGGPVPPGGKPDGRRMAMRMLRSKGIWLQTLDGRSAQMFAVANVESLQAIFPAPLAVQVKLGGGTLDQYAGVA